MQERSIRVFYHVSMMNHYLDVVKEQMDLMVDSGLYDVAESISVGCNGNSTGIACMNTNRNCILIEKEQKYFDIINERIDKYKQQRAGEFSFENQS